MACNRQPGVHIAPCPAARAKQSEHRKWVFFSRSLVVHYWSVHPFKNTNAHKHTESTELRRICLCCCCPAGGWEFSMCLPIVRVSAVMVRKTFFKRVPHSKAARVSFLRHFVPFQALHFFATLLYEILVYNSFRGYASVLVGWRC